MQLQKISQDERNNFFYQAKITAIFSQKHKVFKNPNLQFKAILTTNKQYLMLYQCIWQNKIRISLTKKYIQTCFDQSINQPGKTLRYSFKNT